jgi:hypothetical protein
MKIPTIRCNGGGEFEKTTEEVNLLAGSSRGLLHLLIIYRGDR